MNVPKIYVSWYENKEPRKTGPFYSVTVDGVDVLTHKWFTLEVQQFPGEFRKITVPRYFSISA